MNPRVLSALHRSNNLHLPITIQTQAAPRAACLFISCFLVSTVTHIRIGLSAGINPNACASPQNASIAPSSASPTS